MQARMRNLQLRAVDDEVVVEQQVEVEGARRGAWDNAFIWGSLVCVLAGSALASALTAGSAERGALMMLAFGLGTLPNLLLAGLVLARLNELVRRPVVRTISGLLVLGFGLYGFFGLARLSGWL